MHSLSHKKKTNYLSILLPTRSEGRGILWFGSIPVAIHPLLISRYENYCIIHMNNIG